MVALASKRVMDKYRIDKFPVSYYLNQFRAEDVEILPYREAGYYLIEKGELKKVESSTNGKAYHFSEQLPQGVVTISYGEDELDFDIYFPVENGIVDMRFIDLAREILAELPSLDAIARKVPSELDHEEHLAYINLDDSEIELHYFASTVNTEWSAYFKKQQDGAWHFEGLG